MLVATSSVDLDRAEDIPKGGLKTGSPQSYSASPPSLYLTWYQPSLGVCLWTSPLNHLSPLSAFTTSKLVAGHQPDRSALERRNRRSRITSTEIALGSHRNALRDTCLGIRREPGRGGPLGCRRCGARAWSVCRGPSQ